MDKNYTGADFLSLVQDEAFIDLVKKAENPDKLLEELLNKSPEAANSIRHAFEFIRVNLSNKKEMGQEDFQQILKNIQAYSQRKSHLRKINFVRKLGIAATILVILSFGSLVIYRQLSKDPLTQFAQSIPNEGDQAMIVLSNGSSQVLKNNDSFIDYNSNMGEVIVRNGNGQEKIENRNEIADAALNQIKVPFGQRQKIRLSDGTLVQLNSGSSLTFPAIFTGKNREVYLKGEGFFEVSRNEKFPFIVKTDHIDIKVLGTKFNVSAYVDERLVSAVLVEGKVNVSHKNQILADDEFTLKPGQGCFYTVSNQKTVVNDVDIDDYILWKDGLYKFQNMPLVDIVNRVQRYYNQSVQIEGEKLADILVSGKLVLSGDFQEVMQYLSKTIEGKYEITPEGNYLLKQ
jgi:ferric-dicitrate binding protein FerR (iron transport regulator)